MMNVQGPSQREQDVDVEQGYAHGFTAWDR
jgi:hypothetical protein